MSEDHAEDDELDVAGAAEEQHAEEPDEDLEGLAEDPADPADDNPDNPEDEESEEPAAEAEEPAQPRSRAARRIDSLRTRLAEREEELARLRATVEQHSIPSQPQIDPARAAAFEQEEAERIAMLPAHERDGYWAARMEREILQNRFETRDMLDHAQFQQIMRDRRLPASYGIEVDTLLQQARQNGMNPSREWLLNLIIGRHVLAQKDREAARQRAAGARRIASQTTRPGGAATRSTVANTGGRRNQDSASEDEALLGSVTLGHVLNSSGG